ncbi:MAG: DUF4373 domain-containing protein [Bacteroidales bacterium]|jgi:hypothetical protein|nr:DUF4373 domain-containing protein [Bacteroidales bacterium]
MNSYFPHDSNARNSVELISVRMKFGIEGYGIYFMILERLRDEPDYMSIRNYDIIAYELRTETDKVKSIVEDFGLFDFTDDGKCFYSESFCRRMEERNIKTKVLSDSGKKGAEKRWNKGGNSHPIATLSNTDSHPIATPIASDSNNMILDNIKVDNIKLNNIKLDLYPLQDIVEIFNSDLPLSIPKIKKLNEKRKNKVKLRLSEFGDSVEIQEKTFREIIEKIKKSDFLQGENKNSWIVTFDWIFENSTNWTKILEGNFDNKERKSSDKKKESLNVNDKWKNYEQN